MAWRSARPRRSPFAAPTRLAQRRSFAGPSTTPAEAHAPAPAPACWAARPASAKSAWTPITNPAGWSQTHILNPADGLQARAAVPDRYSEVRRYSELQLKDEIFHGHGVMYGDVFQDRVRGTHPKWVVTWNGCMVFAEKAFSSQSRGSFKLREPRRARSADG
jgi:hypothetical protein